MHICFFTHYTDMMGANRSMLELLDNLRLLGVDVSVISNGNGKLNIELDKRGIYNRSFVFAPWQICRDGLKNHLLWPWHCWRYPKQNKRVIGTIIECLRERNVDIIHTNSSVINIGAKIAEILRIPHVWHVREYGRYDYNLQYLCGDKKAINYMEEKSAKSIFISNDLARTYKERGLGKNYTIIYNGVSLSNYAIKREPNIYDRNILTLVICGFVMQNKNQREVIEAISLLPTNIKEKIRCKIIGDGDNQYIDILKHLCREMKLEDFLEFMGYRSDVPQILSRAHIAVMPSQREAFGRVTVEYMMAGLAVIASDTGANPEIIKDGVTGRIYHLGNVQDLANCIADFVKNREKLKVIATAGHENALRQFNSMNCAKKILDVYKEIV